MAKRDLGFSSALFFLLLCFNSLISYGAGEAACEFSVVHRNTLYNYSLALPSTKFPHGILSEDGFYKVAVNETILWFQLCDQMIFNHDKPACFDCQDCGGPSRCGMTCSALVSNNLGGYDVCTTIGRASSSQISLIDESNPKKACKSKWYILAQKITALYLFLSCVTHLWLRFHLHSMYQEFVTELTHPLGCAISVAQKGKGLGWFGTLLLIIICLFGGYILVGTVYRFFFLRIHSLEAIPNLEFWVSLPKRTLGCFCSLMSRISGQMGGSRATYSPMTYE